MKCKCVPIHFFLPTCCFLNVRERLDALERGIAPLFPGCLEKDLRRAPSAQKAKGVVSNLGEPPAGSSPLSVDPPSELRVCRWGRVAAAAWQPGERSRCHGPRWRCECSLFGCLYSSPSVGSGILLNRNEGTNQRGFSEKEAFSPPFGIWPSARGLEIPCFYRGYWQSCTKLLFHRSVCLSISGTSIAFTNFQMVQNSCLKNRKARD